MIFQIGFSGSASSLVNALQQWGFVDLIIPFTLIFAVLFALLSKLDLFVGKEGKKYNTIISAAIALLIVIPHVLSPRPDDVVSILNRFLPEFVFVTIAILILLVLVGLVGGSKTVASGIIVGLAGLIAVVYLGMVILSSVSAYNLPFTFLSDPNFQALVIVLLVLGLVVWYIGHEESTEKWYDTTEKWLKGIFGKGNGG